MGALLVHQLRFWLAYGPSATRELAATGHAYLHSLTPWIVGALAVALGTSLLRLRAAWARRLPPPERRVPLWRLWLAGAAALVVLYVAQEILESWLTSGHAEGLASVFGGGGWCSLPAALAVGLAIALVLRGAARILGLLARGAVRRRRPVAPAWLGVAPRDVVAPRRLPLAGAAAGRAPPAVALGDR